MSGETLSFGMSERNAEKLFENSIAAQDWHIVVRVPLPRSP
jgi:hypothetical protein